MHMEHRTVLAYMESEKQGQIIMEDILKAQLPISGLKIENSKQAEHGLSL